MPPHDRRLESAGVAAKREAQLERVRQPDLRKITGRRQRRERVPVVERATEPSVRMTIRRQGTYVRTQAATALATARAPLRVPRQATPPRAGARSTGRAPAHASASTAAAPSREPMPRSHSGRTPARAPAPPPAEETDAHAATGPSSSPTHAPAPDSRPARAQPPSDPRASRRPSCLTTATEHVRANEREASLRRQRESLQRRRSRGRDLAPHGRPVSTSPTRAEAGGAEARGRVRGADAMSAFTIRGKLLGRRVEATWKDGQLSGDRLLVRYARGSSWRSRRSR